MVGILELAEGRGRPETERVGLQGLELLRVRVPAPDKLSGKRLARRVDRGSKVLARAGVRRVLTAAGFPHWEILARRGLEPVDTAPFCQDAAAPLALAALVRQGTAPERGTVCLWAPAVSAALLRAAEALCPRVRFLGVEVPGEGETAAPGPGLQADAAVWFGPGGGEGRTVLRLYGPAPDLAGLAPMLPPAVAETGLDPLPAAALLWEAGRLQREKIAFSSIGQT